MSASDAPRREGGVHTRSGNAMLRTRRAILDGAAACLERDGVRRTTMSEIAAAGGVAKATLYNHFRAKPDVLAALVEAQAAELAEQCRARAEADGLAAALAHAATALAASPPLRRVAVDEPALLTALVVPDEGPRWAALRAAVEGVLGAGGAVAGPVEVELVLRWLLSQLLWPVEPQDATRSADVLVRTLVLPAVGGSKAPTSGTIESRPRPAGLGWPGGPARLRSR